MPDLELLTHTDLDGVGAAIVVLARHPRAQIHRCENGEVDGALIRLLERAGEAEVMIVDHGLGDRAAAAADLFVAAGGRLTLLDHHTSSLALEGRSWATIDTERCATQLAYEHVGSPSAYAEFCALVADHDLWLRRDPRAGRLATLLALLGTEAFMDRFARQPEVQFTAAEELLLDRSEVWREEYLAKKLEQAQVLELGQERWALCYAEQHQSELAERLMAELKVAATAIVNPGKRTVSLRGRSVDVSQRAQTQGGGGHARAAAFSFRGAPLELDLAGFELALAAALEPGPAPGAEL